MGRVRGLWNPWRRASQSKCWQGEWAPTPQFKSINSLALSLRRSEENNLRLSKERRKILVCSSDRLWRIFWDSSFLQMNSVVTVVFEVYNAFSVYKVKSKFIYWNAFYFHCWEWAESIYLLILKCVYWPLEAIIYIKVLLNFTNMLDATCYSKYFK